MGKTFVQCLWIGAVLVGGHCASIDVQSMRTVEAKNEHCECRDRDLPVDCGDLVKKDAGSSYFKIQIFCSALRSSNPLQELYKTLRSSAPKASLVITIDQLDMDVVPGRFLAGIQTHILHLNTTNVKSFDIDAFDGFETRVLDMKTATPVNPPLQSIRRIPKLGTLMLHGYNLEVVPENAFAETLTTLGLSNCGVRQFSENSLPRGLILLNLNGNRDLTAEGLQNVFQPLAKLRTLMLKETGVRGFSKELFSGLKNLISLYLINCNIKTLDEDVFSTLPSLDSLYLGKNSLRNFAFMLGTNVSNLNVDDNNLTALDDELFQHTSLRKLRSLNLSNNGFTEVPVALRHLYELASLSLAGNHISKLNWSALNGLRKLRSLNLEHNELLTIEGYPELPDLWTLDLSGNLLEGLQGTIRTLNVASLNLAANRIEKLSLEELPTTLRSIKLQGNPIHCDSSSSSDSKFDRQIFKELAAMIRTNHGAPFKDCI